MVSMSLLERQMVHGLEVTHLQMVLSASSHRTNGQMRSEILTAVSIKIMLLWDVKPCIKSI
jgi:hypothetical protein